MNNWTTIKPPANQERLFISANWIGRAKQYDYKTWRITKCDAGDEWYWGLCDGDGEEWGEWDDLTADFYYEVPIAVPLSN